MSEHAGWITATFGFGETHVVPLDDAHEHAESADCPCNPRLEIVPENRHHPLYIHHAWDLREVLEEVQQILVVRPTQA